MPSANHHRAIFLFAVLMASIAENNAQRRWGQGGWGNQMGDTMDGVISFDGDSQVGPDSSAVGWGSDPFVWNNNVDNNRPPFRPGQNPPSLNNRPPFSPDQNPSSQNNRPPFGQSPTSVDNRPPFRPGQNPTGNRPPNTSTTTARTTAAGTQRTTSSDDATTTSSTTPNPEQTQCIARCPVSPEYNPVCGSNRMTYNNPGRLRCAASCGTNVQLSHYGVCRQVGQPQTFPRRDP